MAIKFTVHSSRFTVDPARKPGSLEAWKLVSLKFKVKITLDRINRIYMIFFAFPEERQKGIILIRRRQQT